MGFGECLELNVQESWRVAYLPGDDEEALYPLSTLCPMLSSMLLFDSILYNVLYTN